MNTHTLHPCKAGSIPAIQTDFTRNATGKVTDEIRHTGAMTALLGKSFDKLGRIASQTDQAGRVTTNSYADAGLTQTVTTPAGATLITRYHSDGSLLEESGTGQQARYYSYDIAPQGIMTTVRIDSPDGPLVSQTIVDALQRPIIRRMPGGDGSMLEERLHYDANGRLAKRERTGEPAILNEYDSMGYLVKTCEKLYSGSNTPDPSSDRIITYGRQYVHGSTAGSSLLHDAFAQYGDTSGQPAYDAWINGYTFTKTTETRLNYTWNNNLARTTLRQTSSNDRRLEDLSVAISPYGRQELACTVNDGIFRTECRHMSRIDNAEYSTSVYDINLVETDRAGASTHYQYTWNVAGFAIALTDARNNTTTHRYDRAGRLLSITDATGTMTEQYLYHPLSGLVSQMTDAENNTVYYVYDRRGRKTSEYGTAAYPAAYEYDAADRLIKLHTWHDDTQTITTDPAGRPGADTTEWTYASTTGLLLAKHYADGTGETCSYTALGQLKSKTMQDGKTMVHTYETGYPEPRKTEYRNAPTGTAETYVTRSYMTWGQLSSFYCNRTASPEFDDMYTSYEYNACGNLTGEYNHNRNFDAIHSLAYTYDDLGRYTGYRLESFAGILQTVAITHDELDRIEGITCNGNRTFTYGYDPVTGRQQSITYPDGLVKTSTLEDRRDYVREIDYRRGNGRTTVFNQKLEWSPAGRLNRDTRFLEGNNAKTNTYAYNTRGELTGAVLEGRGTCSWQYDNIGNRTTCVPSAWGVSAHYETNNLNQYTSIERSQFTVEPAYDVNGNQTLFKTGDQVSSPLWTVAYNARGASASFTRGDETWKNAYDAEKRRIAFYTDADTGKGSSGDYFIYQGTQIIGIADIDNGHGATRIRETYLWDPTQPEATRPLAMIRLDSNLGTEVRTWELRQRTTWQSSSSSSQPPVGPPNIDVDMQGVYYYLHDHNKNVVGLQEENGYLAARYEYDPYGNLVNLNEGCERWNPFRFSSEYHNDVTGLVDYLYRSYNPIDGRWTQRDPIAEQGGVNLYGFVENKVTFKYDKLGLKDECKEKEECIIMLPWGHDIHVEEVVNNFYKNYNSETCAYGPLGCKVGPPPKGFEIPGFPDVSTGNIGRSPTSYNAGLNPNGGKTEQDRKQGFANLLKNAIESAKEHANSICKTGACCVVRIVFKGIKDRSGIMGNEELKRRLKGTTEENNGWNNDMEWMVSCKDQ